LKIYHSIILRPELKRLLHENRGEISSNPDHKIGYGLLLAREIAARYFATLEYKPDPMGNGIAKIRLRLPLT
jgi:hypothetical protein